MKDNWLEGKVVDRRNNAVQFDRFANEFLDDVDIEFENINTSRYSIEFDWFVERNMSRFLANVFDNVSPLAIDSSLD